MNAVLPTGTMPPQLQGGNLSDLFLSTFRTIAPTERTSFDEMTRAREVDNHRRLDALLPGFRARMDPALAQRFDSLVTDIGRARRRRTDAARGDAFTPSAGFHLSRQLEYHYNEVLREPFPPNNAMLLFPMNTSVPVGAQYHTVTRIFADGEATVYRGGNAGIPRVGVSQVEERFQIRYYVTSFVYSLFEELASAFANSGVVAEKLRVARDVLNQFLNWKTWYGDTVNGIYGVLNYPWLDKKIVATAFDGSASPDDVLEEFNRLANYPAEMSRTTYKPNRVVTSPRVRNYLMTTARTSTSSETIGEFWLRTNALGIKAIDEAQELSGAGPGGTDAVLFFRDDRFGIENVVPAPFATLPVQSFAFDNYVFCWMAHGGVVMRDVGNNILGWVDATP